MLTYDQPGEGLCNPHRAIVRSGLAGPLLPAIAAPFGPARLPGTDTTMSKGSIRRVALNLKRRPRAFGRVMYILADAFHNLPGNGLFRSLSRLSLPRSIIRDAVGRIKIKIKVKVKIKVNQGQGGVCQDAGRPAGPAITHCNQGHPGTICAVMYANQLLNPCTAAASLRYRKTATRLAGASATRQRQPVVFLEQQRDGVLGAKVEENSGPSRAARSDPRPPGLQWRCTWPGSQHRRRVDGVEMNFMGVRPVKEKQSKTRLRRKGRTHAGGCDCKRRDMFNSQLTYHTSVKKCQMTHSHSHLHRA
ncbi:hypothetical protein J1614_005100 [Plenodomus biglobosus]|nr:hypothetical protein J1614_005100 [Plenodomus biglobosus]